MVSYSAVKYSSQLIDNAMIHSRYDVFGTGFGTGPSAGGRGKLAVPGKTVPSTGTSIGPVPLPVGARWSVGTKVRSTGTGLLVHTIVS